MKVGQLVKLAGTYDRDTRALILVVEIQLDDWTWVRARLEARRTDGTYNGVSWDVRRRDDGQLLADGFQPGWTEALTAVTDCIEQEGESWST